MRHSPAFPAKGGRRGGKAPHWKNVAAPRSSPPIEEKSPKSAGRTKNTQHDACVVPGVVLRRGTLAGGSPIDRRAIKDLFPRGTGILDIQCLCLALRGAAPGPARGDCVPNPP